ncbi:ribosome recycling factor [Sphingobacterium sp. UT-1RO-CII-1]|uniref:ribosome recycling factor n=1 Tax=Sphingobacterium sp. UT-1RO-CII-1 TaxID=2995225 RepID=UPI00227B4C83|nr:ribosome recycling factor [Sphingobacterium sp. UT-1RO-CII-1]MCY4778141.1 ribosome recycling factor [Sphingobacterium sp. UT-1RO-CII-1]
MNELISLELEDCNENMSKAITHAESELTKIRAGKATPSMLDGIFVDYYGSMTPLSQISNINTTDARTIIVQPWEKNMLGAIEKAIIDSNIGLNPQNDGSIIRLAVPPLTEERRRDLVKKVREEAEKGRVAIRNMRKDANESIKKLKNDGVSEDEIKSGEAEVQKLTDTYIAKVDQLTELKEKDIMTV